MELFFQIWWSRIASQKVMLDPSCETSDRVSRLNRVFWAEVESAKVLRQNCTFHESDVHG